MKTWRNIVMAVCAPAAMLFGQEKLPEAISDNSFLLEEAYNQDPNVVQHISNLTYSRQTKDWQYILTQEWPVIFARDQIKHQISYSIPYQWPHTTSSGIGDIAVNYRYQLMNDDERFWIAPRLSIILPTGNEKRNLGSGKTTYQAALPVSKRMSGQWAAHFNAGVALTPGVANGSKKETLKTYNLGVSVIWLAKENFNVFLEYVSTYEDEVDVASVKNKATHIINPGICYAKNFGSMQVVPGISMPLQLNGSKKEKQIFVYLSLEHPFRQ